MTRLNAITLDLWDTLITEIPRKNPSLRQLRIRQIYDELTALDFTYDLEVVEKAYELSGQFCDDVWNRHRDMPAEDHFLFMISCIDSDLAVKLKKNDLGRLRKIYTETILQMPPVLMADARKTLDGLKANGYKIGLISNTGRTPGDILRKILDRLHITQYFDFMTFSNEVLVRKPEKEIFLHTLRGLKTVPRLSLHVGDDREADFEGAKKAGMNAVLLDRESIPQTDTDSIKNLGQLLHILRSHCEGE